MNIKLDTLENTILRAKRNVKAVNSALKMNIDTDLRNTLTKLKDKLNLEIQNLSAKQKSLKIQNLKNECSECLEEIKSLENNKFLG